MPIDYSKGKVYRILQDNDKTVYIGSTTQPLSARMAGHRKGIKKWPTRKLYNLMAEVGVDHFSIELVIDFPCDRGEQLRAEEGRHIRLNKTAGEGANVKVAGRTQKEYVADNREAVTARQKAYRIANEDYFAEYRKAYNATNKDAIAVQKKAYATTNKAVVAERNKAWYVANKDAVAARKKAYYERKKAERAAAAAAEPVDA